MRRRSLRSGAAVVAILLAGVSVLLAVPPGRCRAGPDPMIRTAESEAAQVETPAIEGADRVGGLREGRDPGQQGRDARIGLDRAIGRRLRPHERDSGGAGVIGQGRPHGFRTGV